MTQMMMKSLSMNCACELHDDVYICMLWMMWLFGIPHRSSMRMEICCWCCRRNLFLRFFVLFYVVVVWCVKIFIIHSEKKTQWNMKHTATRHLQINTWIQDAHIHSLQAMYNAITWCKRLSGVWSFSSFCISTTTTTNPIQLVFIFRVRDVMWCALYIYKDSVVCIVHFPMGAAIL